MESGCLFYTCNVGNYKAISFPVSINVFCVLQRPVERPGTSVVVSFLRSLFRPRFATSFDSPEIKYCCLRWVLFYTREYFLLTSMLAKKNNKNKDIVQNVSIHVVN